MHASVHLSDYRVAGWRISCTDVLCNPFYLEDDYCFHLFWYIQSRNGSSKTPVQNREGLSGSRLRVRDRGGEWVANWLAQMQFQDCDERAIQDTVVWINLIKSKLCKVQVWNCHHSQVSPKKQTQNLKSVNEPNKPKKFKSTQRENKERTQQDE